MGMLVSPATSPYSLVASHVPPARSSRPPRICGASQREVIATAGRASDSSRLAATTNGIPGMTRESMTRRHMPLREITRQMIDDLASVVFDSADKRRLASSEQRQREGIQTRRIVDDPAVVAQVALGVENWDVKPPVVRTKACRPDD